MAKRKKKKVSHFSVYVYFFSQSPRLKLILISLSPQIDEFISILKCSLHLEKNASWWHVDGEIQLGLGG